MEFQIISINNPVQIKLDFAHLSAYLANHTNVTFGKFHSVYKFSTKGNETSYLLNVLHTLYGTLLKKRCDLLACDIEAFIMKDFFGHDSCSSKHLMRVMTLQK